MTQYLPPNLLALFAPRAALPFLPPAQKLPHEKKTRGYQGIGHFLRYFEDPNETPDPLRIETREERQERKRKERAEQVAYKLEQDIALWDPYKNSASTTDAFKTLFIARINYDTSESKLRREFESYGPIRKINLVHNSDTGKPRGYAFIEYEHERDMHTAYKHADGKKIDGRRVLVDVERARSVKGWLPRRLGGGLGGTRRGGPEVNVKHSGREDSRLDERYLEREREQRGGEKERDKRRSPSRSREHKRRSRSRSRERHRERHKHRESSTRDVERSRDRGGIDKVDISDAINGMPPPPEKRERSRRSRSRERTRDRDRDRKRRRSRSRSRDRKRRDRERDRSGHGEHARDQDDRREPPTPRVDNEDKDEKMLLENIIIKQEPLDDTNSNSNTGYDQGYDYNYEAGDNSYDYQNQEQEEPYIKNEPEDD